MTDLEIDPAATAEPASEPVSEPAPEPVPEHIAATPDEPSAGPTWEDDETSATFFLRAVATLLCGAYLAWAQYFASINPATGWAEWGRWIKLSVVANLVLPLGILWMFFGQGIVHLDWLKDQRSNAWNYGWEFGHWRRHLKWTLAFGGAMLVVMVIFRLTPAGAIAAASYKTGYFPPLNGAGDFLKLLATLVVYMFCWEFFFRGFLLFGMAQGFGPVLAIIVQAVIFGLAHLGKPAAETAGAFAGGLILGAVCWQEKSFAPAFYTHALVHLAWAILVYL